jgi:hypothetical protein
MTAVLRNAILAMLESSRGGTLLDLRRFLIEPEFREDFLESVTDFQVIYFWKKEFTMLPRQSQGPLLTRLNTFLAPRLIRNMVSQRQNRIDFAEVMDGGKIFLAKLSQGEIGEENSYLMGSLLVAKFYQLVMSRQAMEVSSRRHFWLYIDEFHNFVCSSMASILTGARKYRLGLTLAHQELKQIEHRDSNVSGAVLANPYTRICFRLGDDDARKLGSGFSYFEPRDLQNLGVGEAICRFERSDYDFNLKVPFPPQVPDDLAKEKRSQIQDLSRKKYATAKSIVEEQIEKEQADLLLESESIGQDTRKRRAKPAEDSRPTRSSEKKEDSSPEPDRSTVSRDREINDPSAGNTESETPLGQYKTLHEPLKERFISEGEACDYTVEREVSVLGGSGRIDLVFTRGDLKIACEIDVKNEIEYEAKNVRKCSNAGFKRIVVTAPSRKRLQQIEKAVGTSVDPEVGVNYFLPDEFTAALREWAEADPVGGKKERAKPRKQKVRFESGELTSEERREKEKQMLRTLTESMNRKKDLS